MTEKYYYYIDFGTGFELVNLYDNKIVHKFAIKDDNNGLTIRDLEGSFVLKGNDYDRIITINNSSINKYIPIKIYRDGDTATGYLIYNGYFNNYNNFDYNEKTVTIKQFFEGSLIDNFLAIIDKEWFIDPMWYSGQTYPPLPIFTNISEGGGFTVTSRSYKLADVINLLIMNNFDGQASAYSCTSTNFWFNANNAKFDVKKYRIANLNSIPGFGTGSAKKLSLKRLFEILAEMHKIYWYIDNGAIKFKTVNDLCTTNRDVTELVKFQKKKIYNYGLNYKKETISFNENNTLLAGDDYQFSNCIEYQNLAKSSKEHNITEVCTRFTSGSDNYNIDGFFFAYVSETTHKMIVGVGAKSGLNLDNAKFSLANIIDENYRDYMFCNDINFKHNGTQSAYIPNKIRDFIELPPLSLVLDVPENFIDSVIYEISPGNTVIARVMEQSTDLNTNITTLKLSLFSESKNVAPPPPPGDVPDTPPVYSLTIDPANAAFSQSGGNIDIDITSDTSWTVSCAESWVTIDQISGSGNDTVNISIPSTTVARVATVIFTTTDLLLSVEFRVSQSYVDVPLPTISVSPGYNTINRSAQTIVLTVTTTEAWTITNGNSWIHFASLSGSGNATINMDIDSSSIDRNGSVTFAITGASSGVTVYQQQIDIELAVTPETLGFVYFGESKSFDIVTTGTWSAASSQSWCTIDDSDGTGNQTINVTCGAALVARTAIITVTNGIYNRYIQIVQDGEPNYISVSPQGANFGNDGGNININVSSNVNWTCSATDSWITLDRISGVGNGVINISVGSVSASRDSSVIITDGTIVRTVIVGQTYTAPVPTISVTPGYNNVGMGANTISLTITTTEAWTISNPLSWVHFPGGTSGSGNATITMEIDYAAAPRSGTVTFNITGASSGIYISQH
jgi:hypothetical protein